MPVKLLEHNLDTLKELEEFIAKGKDCCVVNPCGSGKTSVMCAFINNHKGARITILTKQKNAKAYYSSLSKCFDSVNVRTYSKMLNDYKEGRFDDYNADYIIADEAHYIGAAIWGNAIREIKKKYKPVFIGFTATPQRFEDQGTDESIITDFFGGNSAGNYTVKDLQNRGIFQEPEYILSIYDLEEEVEDRLEKLEETDLNDDRKRDIRDRLNNIYKDWKKNSCPEVVLRQALPRYMYKPYCNRILVYISSVAEIDQKRREVDRLIRNSFPGKTVTSYKYTYKDTEQEFQRFLKEDFSYIKILYSVDKIMETVHIDDLNIMLMLRPSVSNRIITQQFGRVNSIGNDKKPLIVDMVGNLSNINSINFDREKGSRGAAKNESRPNFNIRHALKYAGLFSAMDSCLVRAVYYTYNGTTDTLFQLCHIYNKDFREVKGLIQTQGMDIEDAFRMAADGRKKIVTQEIFEGIREVQNVKLTEEQKKLAEQYIGTVDRFVERNHIEDEDLRQDMYLVMLSVVGKNSSEKDHLNQKILVRLREFCTKARRDGVTREELYDSRPIEAIPISIDEGIEDVAMTDILKNVLFPEVLTTLTSRERIVIIKRFAYKMTLEEVAKEHNVTRERVRQIEAKALRKLRHPSRTGFLGLRNISLEEVYSMYDHKIVEYSDGRLTKQRYVI